MLIHDEVVGLDGWSHAVVNHEKGSPHLSFLMRLGVLCHLHELQDLLFSDQLRKE